MNVRLWLKSGSAALVLTAGMCLPTASQAQSYDLFDDFGASAFAYGSGTNGSSFSPFTGSTADCFGAAGVLCYDNYDNGFPFVAKNQSGMPATYFPTNALSFQPSTGGLGSDALIQFTAPTAGTYTISGFTQSEDPTGGRGQLFTIYDTVGGLSNNLYSTNITGGYQASNPISTLTAILAAGDTITFGVANVNGDNAYMTTGVEATIQYAPTTVAPVPEPASWAMMLGGFGLAGGAMRARRKTAVRFA